MRRALAVGAALLVAGCSSQPPTGSSDDSDQPFAQGPLARWLIVSDPAAWQASSSNAALGVSGETTFSYISLPPGSLPDSARIRIANLRTADAVSPLVREGGFDPIAIPAVPGDTLEVTVTPLTGAASVTRMVAVKARPPRVVRTNPPKGQTDVPLNLIIEIVVSEPIDPATAIGNGIRLLRGATPVAGTLELDPGGTLLRFSPAAALLPNTSYQLEITDALTDRSGAPLAEPATVSFTTGMGLLQGVGLLSLSGPASIVVGGTARIAPLLSGGGSLPAGEAMQWRSDKPAVATVDETGLVTGVSSGSVTLSGSYGGVTRSLVLRVLIALSVCKSDARFDTGCRLTDDPGDQRFPSMSGNRLVWVEASGSWAITLMDLETGVTKTISRPGGFNWFPAIEGDRVVYAWLPYTAGDWQLLSYDIASGTTTQVSSMPRESNLGRIFLQGDRAVWAESRNGNWDIYLFDFSINTESRLSTDPADQADPAIFGNRVAWSDRRHGTGWWDLYLYDLGTRTETRLTEGTLGRSAAVSADRIVWGDTRGVGFGLWEYPFATGREHVLPAYRVENNIVMSGGYVAWTAPMGNGTSDFLYALDIAAGTQVAVTHIPGAQSTAMSPDYLVWEDNRHGNWDIYIARLGDIFRK